MKCKQPDRQTERYRGKRRSAAQRFYELKSSSSLPVSLLDFYVYMISIVIHTL